MQHNSLCNNAIYLSIPNFARYCAFQRVFTFIYICVQHLCTRSQPPTFPLYNICICTFFAVAAFFLKNLQKKFADSKKSITFASGNQTNH